MTWARKKWMEMDCIEKSIFKSLVAKVLCIHSFCVLTWMGIAISCYIIYLVNNNIQNVCPTHVRKYPTFAIHPKCATNEANQVCEFNNSRKM
jgi:hypothetical protein